MNKDDDKENFFMRLKKVREKAGMSQKMLGIKTGVSTTSVQNWERDIYPKGDTLIQLAEIFDCSIDWLLTGRNYNGALNASAAPLIEVKTQGGSKGNVVELKHEDVIKKFKDKDYALTLNSDLVDLETMHPPLYKEAGSYIKGLAQGVRASQGDRRHDQRRTQEDSEKVPNEGDRRQVKNRRTANGT